MTTKLQNGLEYEKYILNIIKSKYKNCWLWNDIPYNILNKRFYKNNLICDDIGCDIIGINFDDTIDYIQCKNYSTTGIDNTINICDLAGFYNFIAENDIINPIVYYCGKLSQQIVCRQNKIKYINIPHIKINNILEFKPRDYQIEAFNKLKDINRTILSMPCGTGKTLVTFLLSIDYKNIIILTPLISTAEQNMIHFKNYYNNNIDNNYILINCKAERNINNIKIKDKNIIVSTYDSSDIIVKLLHKLDAENTLIIIDEFHNLSNDMITNNTNNMNNMNNILAGNNKIVFVSATPFDTSLYENIFGNVKYELNWQYAIDKKYICDYNFYYPNNDKIIEKINKMMFDKTIVNKTILINKAYFLLESIKLTNVKKCIVYLKTIKESTDFIKILSTINIYFELNIKIYNINYDTTKKKRIEYLNKFTKDDSYINILCNVHILDEGIDIPNCDSIYLTHPNNNPINIIQRISRANRIDMSNSSKIAKVFIWSKDKIKLENVIQNISQIIKIKYGSEKNDIINNNIDDVNNDYIYNNNIYEKSDVNIQILAHKNNIIHLIEKIKNMLDYKQNIEIVFEDETNNPFFNANHIGLLMGYNDIKRSIKDNINKKYMFELRYIYKNYKSLYKNIQGHTKFISKEGFVQFIINSHTPKSHILKHLLIDELIHI